MWHKRGKLLRAVLAEHRLRRHRKPYDSFECIGNERVESEAKKVCEVREKLAQVMRQKAYIQCI